MRPWSVNKSFKIKKLVIKGFDLVIKRQYLKLRKPKEGDKVEDSRWLWYWVVIRIYRLKGLIIDLGLVQDEQWTQL